jgi:hypothetical protein
MELLSADGNRAKALLRETMNTVYPAVPDEFNPAWFNRLCVVKVGWLALLSMSTGRTTRRCLREMRESHSACSTRTPRIT